MADEESLKQENEEILTNNSETSHKEHSSSGDKKHHLTGMYQSWFLDYASYVILERAVPHIEDGLKPVH